MTPPKDFVKRLKEEFPDLRIRWSEKRGCWAIEQQVGRGALPPLRIDPYDDSLIRARDGYWLVCEVRPGTRMPCPDCHLTLPVPDRHFAEVRCEHCIRKGRDGKVLAGYFPLGETLLEHLRSTDPRRGAIERMAKEADEANQKLLDMRARQTRNTVEAGTKDIITKLLNIPSVGYTGRGARFIHMDKRIQ